VTILFHIRCNACAQSLGECRDVLVGRPVDQQRPGFGMDEMVGAGRTNLGQPWRILAASVGQHILSIFEAQDLALLCRNQPASDEVMKPCLARRTSLASGLERNANGTWRPSPKPGRRYGIQISASPKQSRASCSPSAAQAK